MHSIHAFGLTHTQKIYKEPKLGSNLGVQGFAAPQMLSRAASSGSHTQSRENVNESHKQEESCRPG